VLEVNKVHLGDCIDLFPVVENSSVDLVLADPPYGTTACKWDIVIPFEPLWKQLKRITTKNAPIVLMATQPFTSLLICSNLSMFKYCWTWDKGTAVGHLVAKIRPMQQTEDIVVFGSGAINYHPIMEYRSKPVTAHECARTEMMGGSSTHYTKTYTHKYPKTLLRFNPVTRGQNVHPTQKPVTLMEYLLRSYTKEGDTVLDFCCGSGTVGVACRRLKRNFILMEKEKEHFDTACNRVYAATPLLF
jgi:site-specific DNA-methyltransferase (adenine-specific)